MGKYLDKFKGVPKKVNTKANDFYNKKPKEAEPEEDISYGMDEEFESDDFNGKKDSDHNYFDDNDRYDDMSIQPAQRPESFHHFILENQYKDLEMSIRGFKNVMEKETQQWKTIRKKEHCFTDEESEEVLRTAQSHLATDVKLGYISLETFPMLMDAIYQEIAFLFESIAEYRYGRYGSYEKQYEMKLQNHKIFLELFTRVQANYSRSIKGQENKYTHDSVKGQESLQGGDSEYRGRSRNSQW